MPLIPHKAPDGERVDVIAWGTLTSDPYYSLTSNKGIPRTTFYIVYDKDNESTERGFNGKTIQCVCWREVAEMASRLEMRDRVCVLGNLTRDDYRSSKGNDIVMQINVDILLPQALVAAFVNNVDLKNGSVPPPNDNNFLVDETTGDVLFGE